MPKSTHSRQARNAPGVYASTPMDPLPPRIADKQAAAMAELAQEPTVAERIESMQQAVVDDVEPTVVVISDEADRDELGVHPYDDPASDPTAVRDYDDGEDEPESGFRIQTSIGQTCACGCGTKTNSGRNFTQGHDQRLIGVLAQVNQSGREVEFVDGGMLITTDAAGYGARVFSEFGMAKLQRAIKRASDNAAKTPRRTAVRTVAVRPEAPKVPELALGALVRAKVGRHEYDATVAGMNQAGKVTAIKYQLRSGADKHASGNSFRLL